MAYNPITLGSQTTANSQAVVLSNDFQSAATSQNFPVTTAASTVTINSVSKNLGIPIANIKSYDVGNLTNYYLFTSPTNKILYGYYCYNSTSTSAYIQFLDNVGTNAVSTSGGSISFYLGIPPYSAANLTFPVPILFTNGIEVAAVTAASGGTKTSAGVYLTLWTN